MAKRFLAMPWLSLPPAFQGSIFPLRCKKNYPPGAQKRLTEIKLQKFDCEETSRRRQGSSYNTKRISDWLYAVMSVFIWSLRTVVIWRGFDTKGAPQCYSKTKHEHYAVNMTPPGTDFEVRNTENLLE